MDQDELITHKVGAIVDAGGELPVMVVCVGVNGEMFNEHYDQQAIA